MGPVRLPVRAVFHPGRVRDHDLPAVPAGAGRLGAGRVPPGRHPGRGGRRHRLLQPHRRGGQPPAHRPGPGALGRCLSGRGHGLVGGGAVVLAAAGRPGPARRRLRHLLPARAGGGGPPVSRRGGQGHRRLRAGLLLRAGRGRPHRQRGRRQLALGVLRLRPARAGGRVVDAGLARARPRPGPAPALGPDPPVRPDAGAAPVRAGQLRGRVHALRGDRLRPRLLRGPGHPPRADGEFDRGGPGAVGRGEAGGRRPVRPLRRAVDGPAHDAGHLGVGGAHAGRPDELGRVAAGALRGDRRLGAAGGQRHAGGGPAPPVRLGHRRLPGRPARLGRAPVGRGQPAAALAPLRDPDAGLPLAAPAGSSRRPRRHRPPQLVRRPLTSGSALCPAGGERTPSRPAPSPQMLDFLAESVRIPSDNRTDRRGGACRQKVHCHQNPW